MSSIPSIDKTGPERAVPLAPHAQTLTARIWLTANVSRGAASRTIDNYDSSLFARHCTVYSHTKPPQATSTTHTTDNGIQTTRPNRIVQPTHIHRPHRPAPRYRQHAYHSQGVRDRLSQAGRRPQATLRTVQAPHTGSQVVRRGMPCSLARSSHAIAISDSHLQLVPLLQCRWRQMQPRPVRCRHHPASPRT